MAGRIEALALRAYGKKGPQHHVPVWSIREMIRVHGERWAEGEIRKIDDVRAFSVLWEVGLSGHLQEVALEVWRKLV